MNIRKFMVLFLCLGAFLVLSGKVKADNPIVQHAFAPDPAPMVYDDRVYLITTHDEDETVGGFYTMNNWQCFSSTDMVNWTGHGIIAEYTDFAWSDKSDPRAWAPQCVERDGKFYLYVPLHKQSAGICIGVGVSDNPYGPFVDALGKPLIDEGDWNDIDPTVYIDDDGQAYLYFGNPQLRYVLLNDDMISYDKSVGIVRNTMTAEAFGDRGNGESSYAEGPWFYKRNDLYYMVYPAFAGGGSENISYSTSESPTGPWTFGGVILAPNNCYTIHPGVIDYKGHSYVFYHGNPLDKSSSFHRSVCVEEFTYNEDGSINQIEQTQRGPDACDTLNPYERVEAETIAWERGVEVERNKDATCQVGSIHNDNYIKVKDVDFGEKGPISVFANVQCLDESQEGTIDFIIDCDENIESTTSNERNIFAEMYDLHNTNVDTGEVFASIDVKAGVDFEDVEGYIEQEITGVHDVYIVFKSNNNNELFKFDYWLFEKEPEPTPVPQQPTDNNPTNNPTAQQPTVTLPVTNIPATTDTSSVKSIAKIKGLKVKKSGNKAKVSWKKADGASKYEVWCALKKNFKKGLKKITVKKTKATVKKLKKGKTYYFKVRGIADGVKGKFSAVKKIKL